MLLEQIRSEKGRGNMRAGLLYHVLKPARTHVLGPAEAPVSFLKEERCFGQQPRLRFRRHFVLLKEGTQSPKQPLYPPLRESLIDGLLCQQCGNLLASKALLASFQLVLDFRGPQGSLACDTAHLIHLPPPQMGGSTRW